MSTTMERDVGLSRRGVERDGGFSLIEQIIAMSILFTVLMGLLVALAAGAGGIANGRQRTIATSLAKQTIEQLQGSSYSAVAMNLSSPGLATDPSVTGVAPKLTFESEPLVGGALTPYRVVTNEAGATFTVSTFVTAVTPPTGTPHRRITVIVDWSPSTSGNSHSMRFSSLVYPLDYTSYPASGGTGEATGATTRLTGFLGTEVFDDVHLALPGSRSVTSSSTLRQAQGSAGSSTGVVDVGVGPLSSGSCAITGATSDVADCVLASAASIADNDAGSSTGGVAQTVGAPFAAASVATAAGVQVITPAGVTATRASTDACGSCGFGDGDGVPWAEGSSTTTTGSSAPFSAFGATLTGALWSMGAGWAASATNDHDTTGSGVVSSTAKLHAPPVDVLRLDGVAGYTAAVKVGAFDATVNTVSGYTPTAPSASFTVPTIDIWNGTAYQAVTVTPGTPVEVFAAPFVIGAHQVHLTSRVQLQPSTVTSAGTSLKTDAAAQFPSLLVVRVDVAISSVDTGAQTAAFSVSFDFGRISAHSTWIER